MRRILCFGDSNTWGLIPGSRPHARFSEEKRWTGILQKNLKDTVIVEEGLCGRTTIFDDALREGRNGLNAVPMIMDSQWPLDAAVIMLGTNDLKSVNHVSAHTIGVGLDIILNRIERYLEPNKILVVSPMHLGEDIWKPEKDPEFDIESVVKSKELKEVFREIANKRGNLFLAASDYVSPSPVDCEHLDEEGHKVFAKVIEEALTGMEVQIEYMI